jgi:hypothetical protein
MERKTTSIKINPDIWQEVKINCIKQRIDISDWLEQIIQENLGKQIKKIYQKEGITASGRNKWGGMNVF